MKRFRFGLESVRQLREHAERAAKEGLARELAEARRCGEAVSEADALLRAARDDARSDDSILLGHELAAKRAFVERRERERLAALARASVQSNEVERSRAGLEHAAREHETLQRAKARARRVHALEEARVDANALDELATTRHGRTSGLNSSAA